MRKQTEMCMFREWKNVAWASKGDRQLFSNILNLYFRRHNERTMFFRIVRCLLSFLTEANPSREKITKSKRKRINPE